jgi:hypothetical protein
VNENEDVIFSRCGPPSSPPKTKKSIKSYDHLQAHFINGEQPYFQDSSPYIVVVVYTLNAITTTHLSAQRETIDFSPSHMPCKKTNQTQRSRFQFLYILNDPKARRKNGRDITVAPKRLIAKS